MSDPIAELETTLRTTSDVVAGVRKDQYDDPTPCPGFTVAQLMAHVAGWLEFFTQTAEGAEDKVDASAVTVDDRTAATVGDLAVRAPTAFRRSGLDGTVTMMSGEMPAETALAMMLMEYIAHGWDLAVATGQQASYDENAATRALETAQQMVTEQWRGPDGFDTPVDVPDGAPAVDRLLGFLGRDPHWTRPS